MKSITTIIKTKSAMVRA